MKGIAIALALGCTLSVSGVARAQFYSQFLDFEGFGDYTSLTDQYQSQFVTFEAATIISAGMSLNEFDYPPRSGQNVVFDDGGPMRLHFSSPVSEWSAYFTYNASLTVNAYDAHGDFLASISSAYLDNTVSSGFTPNELLALTGGTNLPTAFSVLEILGSSAGGSFVMDDMGYAGVSEVPEPSTLVSLVTAGLMGAVLCYRRRRSTKW